MVVRFMSRVWRVIVKVCKILLGLWLATAIIAGLVIGVPAWLGHLDWSGDHLDFGRCQQIGDSDLQTCTYKDGSTKILKLSDGTVEK
jgi:hypothetical protein